MSLDPVLQKKRLAVMGAIDLVALVCAALSAVGYFKLSLDWALFAFAAALVVGFGAQIWFIAGLRRPDKGV